MGPDGRPVPRGLVSVGDAVATTTPTFGRGLALTAMQVDALLALLDQDVGCLDVAQPFDAWCEDTMLPWVRDHSLMDRELVRRWQGGDVDFTRPLPSAVGFAAAVRDARISEAVSGYFTMTELPDCLKAVEPLVRAVYQTGWRPPYSPGPTRDELVEIASAAVPA